MGMARRNVAYRELADKLTEMGTPESERNIANKISRGGFTAAFFLQCLAAIECNAHRLEDWALLWMQLKNCKHASSHMHVRMLDFACLQLDSVKDR